MLKRSLAVAAAVLVIIAGFATFSTKKASAQSTVGYSGYATITNYGNQWSANAVLVYLNVPYVTNGCPGGAGGAQYYATDPSDPSGPALQSMLLGAFLSGKQLNLTLYGCLPNNGAPIIKGVSVRQ